MSLFTLTISDGTLLEVLSGELSMPRLGAWLAHVTLGEDVAPSGAVLLNVGESPATQRSFHGTIINGEPYQGRAHLVIMGGSGGLLAAATQSDYRAAPTAIAAYELVHDILADGAAGEVEAEGLEVALSGRGVDRWERATEESWSKALGRVAKRFGLMWRVLDTGAVWVGGESWPSAELDGQELDVDTDARIVAIAFDLATARPGTTVAGRRVHRVVFGSEGRGALHYEAPT